MKRVDRKSKIKVLEKLIDAGFDNEKKVTNFELADIVTAKIDNKEIPIVIEMREAAKNHKVIEFLAGEIEKKKVNITGGRENG